MLNKLPLLILALISIEAYSLSGQEKICETIASPFQARTYRTDVSSCNVTVMDGTSADVLKEVLVDFTYRGHSFTYKTRSDEIGAVVLSKRKVYGLSGRIRCVLNPNYGWECLYQNQNENYSCELIQSVTPFRFPGERPIPGFVVGVQGTDQCSGKQVIFAEQDGSRIEREFFPVQVDIATEIQDELLGKITPVVDAEIYPFTP